MSTCSCSTGSVIDIVEDHDGSSLSSSSRHAKMVSAINIHKASSNNYGKLRGADISYHNLSSANCNCKMISGRRPTNRQFKSMRPNLPSLLRNRLLFKSGYSCFSVAFLIFIFIHKLTNAQRLNTRPQDFQVRVGETVQLPCNFEELNNEDNVVLWKRGNDVLVIDEDNMTNDNRIQVKKEELNYILEISAVELYDSANYTCSVTSNPPVLVTHKLQVNVPPSVRLNPPTSPITTRIGKNIVVKCVGTGNPPPTVNWVRRDGGALPPGAVTSDGKLQFASVAESDAGVYECQAANSVGGDAKVTFEMRVESSRLEDTATESSNENFDSRAENAPWVETDRTYIPATLGASVNLSCRYDGNPEPSADWLFSGFKIINFDSNSKFKNGAKFGSVVKNHSVTTFSISAVHEDQFGDYTCKVANKLGTVERIIHLSGRPGPPLISVLNNNWLSWTVQSAQPISEYKVHYRLSSEAMWTQSKLISSSRDDQQGEYWTHKIPLDFLNFDTDYEIQVNAKNELGWGALARDLVKYRSSSSSGKISSNALGKTGNLNGANTHSDIHSLYFALSSLLVVLPALFVL